MAEALTRNSVFRSAVTNLVGSRWTPLIPTVVLAETITGRRRVSGAIDSIVAAHAAGAEVALVLTTDPIDLRRLLADHPQVAIEIVAGQPRSPLRS
jgi:hypothetical protein